eukprot:m.40229 g.40229  ORF g.40229 m.40229 type:complete len:74 (+) comp11699_c0_seq3:2911-3132(+)
MRQREDDLSKKSQRRKEKRGKRGKQGKRGKDKVVDTNTRKNNADARRQSSKQSKSASTDLQLFDITYTSGCGT